MTPLEIQYRLKLKKITQKSIAARLGVSEMSVSDVVNKNIVSDRIMRAVAEAIGEDYLLVFAEYYLSPPKRKPRKSTAP